MQHSVDLFGHTVPEPKDLPQGIQLKSLDELVGHTIRMAFGDNETRDDQVVLLTDTNCYIALHSDDDCVFVDDKAKTLPDLIYPSFLARRGALGQAEAQALALAEKRRDIDRARKQASEARRQATSHITKADQLDREAAQLEHELKLAGSAA